MALARNRNRRNTDIWPGFVDALSTLLLVFIFLLSFFAIAQFFLSRALSGRDEALEKLNRQVSEFAELLSMEQQANAELRINVAQLSASLQSANLTRDDLSARVEELTGALASAESRAKRVGEQASRQEALLNQQLAALRRQLAALEATLEKSEQKDREQQAIIKDLGSRLNVALAAKVHELAGYRSEFFGALRKAIGAHPDIKVVGDRFVFQSELLFRSGSAELGEEGKAELRKLAGTLMDIASRIPRDRAWVLRVDGHTDRVPINTVRFLSNWELSASRALAVVHYLAAQGIPGNRLAATGFGEHQPIALGGTEEANRRNRRIEFKLTER
ncbi:MAG: peptidoglycan -binding protein [Sphingomonadales bacterium]